MSSYQYYGPDWKSIRQDVIKEDGSQCVICFSKEDLEVHHRKPLKEFDSHKKANQRNNLATLCNRCHRRIETIQKAHTRRSMPHFIKELSSEGVDAPTEFIKYLCYNQPKSSVSNASCCRADGCFYPVKNSDITCPECGHLSEYYSKKKQERADSWDKKKYKCKHCGDISEFRNKPWNEHGCSYPNGHHNYKKID